MNNKYFDDWETRKINLILNTNPLLAKQKYEEYLEKYPKDYVTYVKYSSILITLGYFEEALKILYHVETIFKNDNKYNKNLDKAEYTEGIIAASKIRALSYLHRYEEAYDLYASKFDLIKDKVNKAVYTFFRKKMGFPKPLINEESSYVYKQMFNYSEEELLKKLKIHLQEYSMDFEEPSGSMFFSYFPVERVLSEVKKYIPSDKKLHYGFLNDSYFFKYDRNGTSGNITCDYIQVCCFEGTKEILTMFPCNKIDGIDFVDLNYIDYDENHKNNSRVEKFNKKYQKKKTYN